MKGLLEPISLALRKQVDDDEHSASDKTTSLAPTARLRVLLQAIEDLQSPTARDAVLRICNRTGDFGLLGVRGNSGMALAAMLYFVQGVHADRKFEQHFLGCMFFLSTLRPDELSRIQRELSEL